MTKNASELIEAYFDDALSETELNRLSAWIKESPGNAQTFARAAMLHDRLQLEIAMDLLDPSSELEHPEASALPTSIRRISRRSAWSVLAVLAACLLALVGNATLRRSNLDRTKQTAIEKVSFASIARIVQVNWTNNSGFSQGDRVGQQRVRFDSGLVRFQFDDGVEVTLEGPADYELIGPGKTRLNKGLLSATVPPGAEGFRVDTPSARVVDLGTAFGIRLDDSGGAEVTVFDGLVDVALHDSAQTRRLKEGEALRVSARKEIEQADFDTGPFEKLWPVSSGIAGSTGAFRYAPPWPRRLRFVTSDRHIFVIPDGYQQSFQSPMAVNISEPGTYARKSDLTPHTIPADTQVQSFLLHFRPSNSEHGSRIDGSISFDRPVLGLMVLQKELAASKKLFTPHGVEEVKTQRQLELRDGPAGDLVELSDDRRTVRLSLAVPNRFSDLVRVIVDASPNQALPANQN